MPPLLRALRPAQWVKNLFAAAPLLFAGLAGDPRSVGRTVLLVAAWCAVASAVYLLNDLADLEADRRHPRKRRRPLASGALAPGTAALTALVLGAAGFSLAFFLAPAVGAALVGYAGLNVLYTLWLKHQVILDVMVVASGFVLRVLSGAWALAVPPSAWLVVCTALLALFLGFAKRRQELAGLDGGNDPGSRSVLASYTVRFLDSLQTALATATVIAYTIYAVSPRTVASVGDERMLATAPLVLYGLLRYLWLTEVRGAGENPTHVALADPGIRWTVVCWVALSAALLYLR